MGFSELGEPRDELPFPILCPAGRDAEGKTDHDEGLCGPKTVPNAALRRSEDTRSLSVRKHSGKAGVEQVTHPAFLSASSGGERN